MGRGCDLTPAKKSEIRTLLLHTSNSQRKIAELTGVSAAIVNKIKANIVEKLSLSPKRKGRCGRKRMTTPRDDRQIRDICLTNRKKSSSYLTKLVKESGLKVSQRTVRRRLVEEGLTGHRPSKKPKLTEAMKKKRLAWARDYRHMTTHDWSKVAHSPTCLPFNFAN